MPRKKNWKHYESSAPEEINESELPIISHRQGEVPGTHSVTYVSEVDCIEITHEAYNRKGFALGAVVAAEWTNGKKGVLTMRDLLKLS